MEEDFEDMLEDIEDKEEIYMEPAQKGTGNRKTTAAFVLGGAVLGGLVGDIFGASEYELITEVGWSDGAYGGFENSYHINYQDTGLIESYTDGSIIDRIDSLENEALLNGEIDYMNVGGDFQYDYFSTVGGGIGGGIGGYGADRLKSKIELKKKEEQEALEREKESLIDEN